MVMWLVILLMAVVGTIIMAALQSWQFRSFYWLVPVIYFVGFVLAGLIPVFFGSLTGPLGFFELLGSEF